MLKKIDYFPLFESRSSSSDIEKIKEEVDSPFDQTLFNPRIYKISEENNALRQNIGYVVTSFGKQYLSRKLDVDILDLLNNKDNSQYKNKFSLLLEFLTAYTQLFTRQFEGWIKKVGDKKSQGEHVKIVHSINEIFEDSFNSTTPYGDPVVIVFFYPYIKWILYYYNVDFLSVLHQAPLKVRMSGIIYEYHRGLFVLNVDKPISDINRVPLLSIRLVPSYLNRLHENLVLAQRKIQAGYNIAEFDLALRQIFTFLEPPKIIKVRKSIFTNNISDSLTPTLAYSYKLKYKRTETKLPDLPEDYKIEKSEIIISLLTDTSHYVIYQGYINIELNTGFQLAIVFKNRERIRDFLDGFIKTYGTILNEFLNKIQTYILNINQNQAYNDLEDFVEEVRTLLADKYFPAINIILANKKTNTVFVITNKNLKSDLEKLKDRGEEFFVNLLIRNKKIKPKQENPEENKDKDQKPLDESDTTDISKNIEKLETKIKEILSEEYIKKIKPQIDNIAKENLKEDLSDVFSNININNIPIDYTTEEYIINKYGSLPFICFPYVFIYWKAMDDKYKSDRNIVINKMENFMQEVKELLKKNGYLNADNKIHKNDLDVIDFLLLENPSLRDSLKIYIDGYINNTIEYKKCFQ